MDTSSQARAVSTRLEEGTNLLPFGRLMGDTETMSTP